jgi:hypothetical protein
MNTEEITPAFVREMGIDKPKKISGKANELVRMLNVKCRLGLPSTIASFGAVALRTVCVELACKLNNIALPNKEDAVRQCGVNMMDYQTVLITIQNILQLKFPVSIQELCVHFACPGMKSTVDKYLEQFEERFTASLHKKDENAPQVEPQKVQKKTDFSNPAFRAAAFYQCAKNSKQKIDRNKLIQFTNCNPNQFNAVVESMEKLCSFSSLAAVGTFKEIKERSKKRKRIEEEENEEEEAKDDDTAVKEFMSSVKSNAIPPPKALVEKKEKKDIKETKPVTEKPKEEPIADVKPPPRKKLKQMSLNFFKK